MRSFRSCQVLPTWTLLVLWTLGIVLSALPEPIRASTVCLQKAEGIETLPVLAAQDWRQSISVRVETSAPNHPKNNDLKKFHAAFASAACIAVPSSLHTQRGFSQPVPESWHGFSVSSRSPPSA